MEDKIKEISLKYLIKIEEDSLDNMNKLCIAVWKEARKELLEEFMGDLNLLDETNILMADIWLKYNDKLKELEE